jgi:hypothetical protein
MRTGSWQRGKGVAGWNRDEQEVCVKQDKSRQVETR